MKKINFPLAIFLIQFAVHFQALATPVVLAPGVSPQEFQASLHSNSSLVSILEIFKRRALEPSPQEEKLYTLADQLSLPTPAIIAQIKNVHENSRLSATGVLFIRDLLEKISSRSFSKLEKNEIESLYCMGESLVADKASRCSLTGLASSEIKRRFPWADGLIVEYKFFDLNDSQSLKLDKISNYHFQIISLTHKAQDFYGSYEQMLQQNFTPETWVAGTCDEFSSSVDDFTLNQEALAYFSKDCLKAVRNPTQTGSTERWVRKNRHWLYAAGAVVLGGLAYSMKDKTVVVNTSLFK